MKTCLKPDDNLSFLVLTATVSTRFQWRLGDSSRRHVNRSTDRVWVIWNSIPGSVARAGGCQTVECQRSNTCTVTGFQKRGQCVTVREVTFVIVVNFEIFLYKNNSFKSAMICGLSFAQDLFKSCMIKDLPFCHAVLYQFKFSCLKYLFRLEEFDITWVLSVAYMI